MVYFVNLHCKEIEAEGFKNHFKTHAMKTLDVTNADLNRVAEILGELRTTKNVYRTLENISEDEALLILRSLEARQECHREMKRHLTINIILTELFKVNQKL